MKGVILTLCPRAQVVDITHEIPPHDVATGAFTLSAAAPWFARRTVFACVVDPGVGTARRLLAAEADGRYFVGPDNGLLALVLERANRPQVVELTRRRDWLSPVSRTFQGRDIIAPVAARLAGGARLARFGRPVRAYATLPLPRVRTTKGAVHGQILFVDPFGNLITNLPQELLARTPEPSVRFRRRRVRVVSSYGEGQPGEWIALPGSTGYLELAIREQSAAAVGGRRGDPVQLFRGSC